MEIMLDTQIEELEQRIAPGVVPNPAALAISAHAAAHMPPDVFNRLVGCDEPCPPDCCLPGL